MKRESFGWVMAKCSEAAYMDGKTAKPLYKDLLAHGAMIAEQSFGTQPIARHLSREIV